MVPESLTQDQVQEITKQRVQAQGDGDHKKQDATL